MELAQNRMPDTVSLADEFRVAIGTEQLSLHYQPIINLATGRFEGFEALMRWTHPTRGPVSPGEFIPVAESSGLIVEASRWALREACRALKRMESRVGINQKLFMSVNFSATDFAEENFLDQLYTILSETDVPPSRVHLEITERLLLNQPENAKETLDMCRKAGLCIAIDDFGTGGSSESYLDHYPIDTLKIDQTLVRGMFDDDAARDKVLSMIELGRGRAMNIIAEGVETAAEADFLKENGCGKAQGYYFGRPQSEKDTTARLSEWAAEGRLR